MDPGSAQKASSQADVRPVVPGRVLLALCDLSRPCEVRGLAKHLASSHETIDVLVNNAGLYPRSREATADGLERTFATNVLGYFLLTNLLLERLRAAGKARIVNVASTLAFGLRLDDLQMERRWWSGTLAYAQSKQANRMLTWALARRLEGTGVTANACHPGFVATDLQRNQRGLWGVFVKVGEALFARTAERGADTPTWLASSPDVEGQTGTFWHDRREISCSFRDEQACEALWEACERITAAI